jgi:hypothetical protein
VSKASGIDRGDEPAPHTDTEERGQQSGQEKTPEVGHGETETLGENAKYARPLAWGMIVSVKML